MNKKLIGLLFIVCTMFSTSVFADELIVLLRHGEKPDAGLGQLTCQGLNRSLALPNVLLNRYGTPDEIFAPNPSILKDDKGVKYAYIRPLATIEPTAIKVGKSINVEYGFLDKDSLLAEVLADKNANKTIFISWEHHLAEQIVKDLMSTFDKSQMKSVPKWQDDDFDSIYVVRIFDVGNKKFITLEIEKQNLDNVSKDCP